MGTIILNKTDKKKGQKFPIRACPSPYKSLYLFFRGKRISFRNSQLESDYEYVSCSLHGHSTAIKKILSHASNNRAKTLHFTHGVEIADGN